MVKLHIVKKIRALLSTFVLLVVFVLLTPSQVRAAVTCNITTSGSSSIQITNFADNGTPITATTHSYILKIYVHNGNGLSAESTNFAITNGETSVIDLGSAYADLVSLVTDETFTFDIYVVTENGILADTILCQTQATVTVSEELVADIGDFVLCNQIAEGDQKEKCNACFDRGEGSEGGIWTAVGCIKRDPKGIVQSVLQIGLGIAGGVALLMILSAAFLFSTSQGDVKRTTEARELMSSAVIGLLFIIFSITILQFIGVTIFHIPGFGDT
jgi:hypothetical protein